MICFQNKGLIPIEAIKTMGVSVKEGEGAIGFFGTGLKYAIAVLLREQQQITIWRGTESFKFGVKKTTIRGRDFDLVTMNGVELGFTTDLGKMWKMWMAYRELYCNCCDEDGFVFDTRANVIEEDDEIVKEMPGPEEGYTLIEIEGGAFAREHASRGDNFILTKAIHSDDAVEVHEGERPYIFYRGVRVFESKKSLYGYNVLGSMDLTEDRTLKYPFQATGAIAKTIMKMTDKDVIRRCITAPLGRFESELDFNAPWDHSEEFATIALKEYQANPVNVNKTLIRFIHRLNPDMIYEPCAMTPLQQKQLNKAVFFCKGLGYDSDRYKVIIVETLGPTVMAQALRDHASIVLAKGCFDKGTKYVASTLLEEIIHLREGLDDESRALQTYLFDKIISLGEQITGEPL